MSESIALKHKSISQPGIESPGQKKQKEKEDSADKSLVQESESPLLKQKDSSHNIIRIKSSSISQSTPYLHQSEMNSPKNGLIHSEHTAQKLPPRFNVLQRVKPISFNSQQVMGDLETKIEEVDTQFPMIQQHLQYKLAANIQPSAIRLTKANEFKQQPIRRKDFDYLQYKDIFIAPSQKLLDETIQQKEIIQNSLKFFSKPAPKISSVSQWDGAPQENEKSVINMSSSLIDMNQNLHTQAISISSLKEDISLKKNHSVKLSPQKQLSQIIQENVVILEQNMELDQSHLPQVSFFDQQIQIQVPEKPNLTIASPLAPGNGYAPSLPLVNSVKDNQSLLKDLLTRAQAGMQAGDLQKEAHLNFYLGMVYDTNKSYGQALKYYNQFNTCARLLEDQIGISIGSNRIGICFFNLKDYQNSIDSHQINIQLSDIENLFAGYYNSGICYRQMKQYLDSITNFDKGLKWAIQRDEPESICLAYGQIGVTYREIGQREKSLENFKKCYEIGKRLKNSKLQLDSLVNIIKIIGFDNQDDSDECLTFLHDALDCARIIDDQKTTAICMANLGIIEGNKNHREYLNEMRLVVDVEQDVEIDNQMEESIVLENI